jgi:iron complex outermembrane receptor protein
MALRLGGRRASVHSCNAIEPLLAEELEVLKGPAALLYGGTAIGGAVNVIDRRVPPAIPKSGLEGAFSTRYNSVF